MKTKLSFMLLACAISTSIFAQEKDFRNKHFSRAAVKGNKPISFYFR